MANSASSRISTGVTGLDEILQGGFIPQRAYLVRGGPGAGKTMLGLHFLSAGASENEPVLLISLAEPERALKANAAGVGLDLAGINVLDLSPTSDFFVETQAYEIFAPAEVERGPMTQRIVEQVRELQPTRVFVDALTQLRYLSNDPYGFRKQVLSLLRFLLEEGATVLFSSESSPSASDEDLQFLSDGVIQLSDDVRGRTVQIIKFRGSRFEEGRHMLRLTGTGMQVFPRLVPPRESVSLEPDKISSGIPTLDMILHGGLEWGLVTLITGPAGAGKTTLGLHFVMQAAQKGARCVVYTFNEQVQTLVCRTKSIGVNIDQLIKDYNLDLVQVEPLIVKASEFAMQVRREVEEHGTRLVMLDSLASYRLAMQGEDEVAHLHALSRYLRNVGVTLLLINEMEGITGDFYLTEAGVSHLADNILFLRYLEMDGALHKILGVLKKRTSKFEKTLHRMEITEQGIELGPPLRGMRGILNGGSG